MFVATDLHSGVRAPVRDLWIAFDTLRDAFPNGGVNRCREESPINLLYSPRTAELAIQLKSLHVVSQAWKIRLPLECNFRVNVHEECKIRLRK